MERKGRTLEEAEEDPTPLKKRKISTDEEEHEEILEKVRFCKYYAKGSCTRGDDCLFLHKREVCKYWLQGNCTKEECQFLHEFKKSRIPQCYFDRTRGICNNPGCMFLHLNHLRKNEETNSEMEETTISLSLGSQPEELPVSPGCQACHSLSQLQNPSGLWRVSERWVSLFPHSISSWFPPQLSKWTRKELKDSPKDLNGFYLEREKSKWEGKKEASDIQRSIDTATLTLGRNLTENSVPELMRLARKLLK